MKGDIRVGDLVRASDSKLYKVQSEIIFQVSGNWFRYLVLPGYWSKGGKTPDSYCQLVARGTTKVMEEVDLSTFL